MDVKDIILAASIAKGAGGSGGGVTKEYVDTQVGTVSERVDDVEDVIPSTATAQNKLATSADVSSTAILSTSTTSPVTDSADALVQGLTIYGRSEVVDGEIKSVGEGYAVVRLADLTWNYNANGNYFFTNPANIISAQTKPLCDKYSTKLITAWFDMDSDKLLGIYPLSDFTAIRVNDYSYTTVSDFVASLGDATLCYQLADLTQGNTIAIKTDDGTGIDGTMAVFETALPLRGVSDTVRDKLTCTAESKQVETVCGKFKLADLEWVAYPSQQRFYAEIPTAKFAELDSETSVMLSTKYTVRTWNDFKADVYDKFIAGVQKYIGIRDTDYTTVSDFVASLGDAELVYELATPITTPLTSAEISAFRGLKTYGSTTNITITDDPEFELEYLKNSDNGQAVADIQTDLQGQIDGLKIKTLTYTGTGSSTNTITFPEIPVCIFSFVNKQRDSYGNFGWTNPFTWDLPYITIYYTGSSSGSQSSAVSYTGNTMTLTGSDAGLAMNRSDTEYNIYYI